jgi:phage baseplate assembly protein W
MLLVEMLPVVIGHQLQTEVEETWRQAVTRPVGMPEGAEVRQRSNHGSQAPLMVWIEVEKTPKCRVIAEVQVARACRRHPVAAEVAHVEAAEADTPAVAVVVHEAVAEVAVAVAVVAAAGDNL